MNASVMDFKKTSLTEVQNEDEEKEQGATSLHYEPPKKTALEIRQTQEEIRGTQRLLDCTTL